VKIDNAAGVKPVNSFFNGFFCRGHGARRKPQMTQMSRIEILGSARVPRAGERVLTVADFSFSSLILTAAGTQTKDCFGATPKPARETRALPRAS
jgi:hypothetical protein